MRQALLAALRRDPDLLPKVKESLRTRIDERSGPVSTVVQAATALEPILEDVVRKRPSKLGNFGLKSAHLLADFSMEDAESTGELQRIARNSSVGIVFVDVAGFTEFTAKNGDEAAIELLNKLHRIVERKTKDAGGTVVKHLGDGYLLAFPSANQAVRGAVALCEAAKKAHATDPTFQARLRIAVHAGEPLFEQDDLLGHDVNLTARLLDHCKPGEVIVSEAAKELAEKKLRAIEFGRRRNVKIRGLSMKVPAYSAGRLPAKRSSA
jgi:class 3 adenylate cyclase